jgi:hypothetical protein
MHFFHSGDKARRAISRQEPRTAPGPKSGARIAVPQRLARGAAPIFDDETMI